MKAKANNLPDYVTQGEARTAALLINALIARGYAVSVHDGEEYTVKQSIDGAIIASALASTGIDSLLIRDTRDTTEYPESGRSTAPRVGTILLIWGNDPQGDELVADWSWDAQTESGRAFNVFLSAWTGVVP